MLHDLRMHSRQWKRRRKAIPLRTSMHQRRFQMSRISKQKHHIIPMQTLAGAHHSLKVYYAPLGMCRSVMSTH